MDEGLKVYIAKTVEHAERFLCTCYSDEVDCTLVLKCYFKKAQTIFIFDLFNIFCIKDLSKDIGVVVSELIPRVYTRIFIDKTLIELISEEVLLDGDIGEVLLSLVYGITVKRIGVVLIAQCDCVVLIV